MEARAVVGIRLRTTNTKCSSTARTFWLRTPSIPVIRVSFLQLLSVHRGYPISKTPISVEIFHRLQGTSPDPVTRRTRLDVDSFQYKIIAAAPDVGQPIYLFAAKLLLESPKKYTSNQQSTTELTW